MRIWVTETVFQNEPLRRQVVDLLRARVGGGPTRVRFSLAQQNLTYSRFYWVEVTARDEPHDVFLGSEWVEHIDLSHPWFVAANGTSSHDKIPNWARRKSAARREHTHEEGK